MEDNYLPNGSVLPFGLMSHSAESSIVGFNKTYANTALRLGIVVKSYDVTNPANLTKLTTEYDVSVFEQIADHGSSIITYRNCVSAEGMGSIADFFERTLRVKKGNTNNNIIDTKNQNGAVVLILCLDGVTEKAIIIGAITHPDRKSNLIGKTEYLEGEFNGVNIKVDQDGSATFTFKGATNNNGKVIDSSQGNTIVSIEKNGSFQIKHSTITFRLDRNGVLTATSTGDANINCNNANVTAQATATVEGKLVKLGKNASEAVVKGDTFKKLFDQHIHPTPIGPSGPPSIPLDPSALSKKAKTE